MYSPVSITFQIKRLLLHYMLLIFKQALLSQGKHKHTQQIIVKLSFRFPQMFLILFLLIKISNAANYHNIKKQFQPDCNGTLQIPTPHSYHSPVHTSISRSPHTTCPTSSLRPASLLTAQGRWPLPCWPLPCPEGPVLLLGPLGPANSRARAGQAEPGRAGR